MIARRKARLHGPSAPPAQTPRRYSLAESCARHARLVEQRRYPPGERRGLTLKSRHEGKLGDGGRPTSDVLSDAGLNSRTAHTNRDRQAAAKRLLAAGPTRCQFRAIRSPVVVARKIWPPLPPNGTNGRRQKLVDGAGQGRVWKRSGAADPHRQQHG